MMIHYISDLHFNHVNIMKLCGRPHNDVRQMNEFIIKRWNEVVKNLDEVYILGDIGLPKCNDDREEIIRCLRRLKGKKHLIVGNHDDNKLVEECRRQGLFVSIQAYKEIRDDGKKVVLFHYPIEEWNGYHKDTIHLYGHTHEIGIDWDNFKSNRYHVGYDMHLRPVTLKKLEEFYD